MEGNNKKEARDQVTHYVASAKRRLALEAAAEAWSNGVPWADAIKICTKAIKKANPKAKPLPKGAPKRRAQR